MSTSRPPGFTPQHADASSVLASLISTGLRWSGWKEEEAKAVLSSFSSSLPTDTHILLLTTLLAIWAVSFAVQLWKSAGTKAIPGPSRWPWSNTFSSQSMTQMAALADKYGTVFQLRSGIMQASTIVVCDPAAVTTVLIDQEAFMPKPNYKSRCWNEIMHPHKMPCLLTHTHTSDAWKRVRKYMAKAFTVEELREDFTIAKDKALVMAEMLAKIKGGPAVRFSPLAKCLSMDVVGSAKLGYNFDAMGSAGDTPLLTLLKACQDEAELRVKQPWRRWGWLLSDDLGDASIKYTVLQAFVAQIWVNIKDRGYPPEGNWTLAAQLMRLWGDEVATETEVVVELTGWLLAGHEALGQSISWALQCLAANPEAQERLHSDLEEAGFCHNPETLTFDTVGSLGYLDAVVREVLRLHPTFGSSLMRVATKDVKLGDYRVPRGSQVCVCPYAMHHSSHLWTDPTAFRPERWMQEKGAEKKAGGKDNGKNQRHNGMATWPDVQQAHSAMVGDNDQQGPAPATSNNNNNKDKSAESKGDNNKGEGKGEGSASKRKNKKNKGKGGSGQEQEKKGDKGGKGKGGDGKAKAAEEVQSATPQMCASQAFAPFGMGPRSCAAQVFCQATLKATLSMLIAFYKFELAAKPQDYESEESQCPLRFKMRYA